MANNLIMKPSFFIPMSLIFACLHLHYHYLAVVAAKPSRGGPFAPALYVFGGSIFDSGNNNYLLTLAKANYKPYGIDFPWGTATGRFTNGATIVDFIAEWLWLPYVPAYLSLSDDEKGKITTGVNYASGSAGILPETGTAIGDNLSLDEQINYFEQTVGNDLPKVFKIPILLSKYLAKSIFVISIGTNDYINNYLQPANYNSSKTYTPQQFGDLLLNTLKQQLTSLYNLGARKFVVFDNGPIGCLPAIINRVTPKPTTPCVEGANDLIQIFNNGFPDMIQELSSSLYGSTFVRGEIYKQIYDQNQNPSNFGFTAGRMPCCVLGGTNNLTCVPNQPPCENRDAHIYWDAFHTTQRVNYEIASGCFQGSSPCFPINIQQLVQI